MSGEAVALEAATVRIGGRTVWSDVDVAVGHGEFVAVLGGNGTGKSTMIKVLLGVQPLESGRAVVLGRAPADARHDIGYLPQRHGFDAATRIRGVDIVRLGYDGDRFGLPLALTRAARQREAEARRRVHEVIELVQASAYAHRPIGELSGGEQQRLLIAQALVRRPRLLLLDEPLDSLDLPNQGAVSALLARISRDEDVTIMLVAHDVNPIITYLDRVVYLGQGAVASGAPRDVITSETLSKLYGTPIEVLSTSDGRLVVVGQPEPPAHHSDRHSSTSAPTVAGRNAGHRH